LESHGNTQEAPAHTAQNHKNKYERGKAMTIKKQNLSRIKNEINKKKLARKEERQKKSDRHWHMLSKLRAMESVHRSVVHGF